MKSVFVVFSASLILALVLDGTAWSKSNKKLPPVDFAKKSERNTPKEAETEESETDKLLRTKSLPKSLTQKKPAIPYEATCTDATGKTHAQGEFSVEQCTAVGVKKTKSW